MNEKLSYLLTQIDKLPPLPENVRKISSMLESVDTSSQVLGEEIAKDVGLSAQVLKMVNSGFYGFTEKISELSHATVLLGFNAMKTLVVSSVMASKIEKGCPGLYDHSLACARACHYLATQLHLPNADTLQTIGLIHDIGKVVIAEFLPEEFEQITALSRAEQLLVAQAEHMVLGLTHAHIGAMVLKHWSLPDEIVETVAKHHFFLRNSNCLTNICVVNLADFLVQAMCFGWSGNWRVPKLQPEILAHLKIDVTQLEQLIVGLSDVLYDIPKVTDR